MTSSSHTSPAGWTGLRTLSRGAIGLLLALIVLVVLLGAIVAALLSGHPMQYASVPYLDYLWTLRGR